MKNTIYIFLLLPFLMSAQSNEQGTLKLRKQTQIQYHATISGHFDGMITKETLLANPIIKLNSDKKGEILSFSTSYTYSGNFCVIKTKGYSLNPKALSRIKNNTITRIYFDEIYAKIDNDTIRLNNISLDIGARNSAPINPNKVCFTYFKSDISNNISKSNPSQIRSIRGLYDKKILQVKSYSVNYTLNGNNYTKIISNEQDIKMLINTIKSLPRGTRLIISDVKFQNGSTKLYGTTLSLKVTK